MLAFERAGQGVPLVFVHAFPLSRKMWTNLKSQLVSNYQVFFVDLPGFGETPLASNTTSMEFMAREIVSTLDAIGIKERFFAAGVSMGGYVLFQLARLFPERLNGLALISTRSAADSSEIRERRMKTIEMVQKTGGLEVLSEKMIPQLLGQTTLGTQPDLVSRAKEWIGEANPAGVCSALRGMADRPDSTGNLRSIFAPTLVLSGREDVFVKTKEMEQMARAIPDAEFHVVEKAGHLIPLEKPTEFCTILNRFLHSKVIGN